MKVSAPAIGTRGLQLARVDVIRRVTNSSVVIVYLGFEGMRRWWSPLFTHQYEGADDVAAIAVAKELFQHRTEKEYEWVP